MLYFSRWTAASVIAIIVAVILIILPNFFSQDTVDDFPGFLPKGQVTLGLDLQGGSYLLYQIEQQEYVQQRLTSLVGEVRSVLGQQPRVLYQGLGVVGRTVQLRLVDTEQIATARQRLEPLRNPLSSSLFAGGVNEFDLSIANDGLVRFSYSDAGFEERLRGLVATSIEVIDRRINALGTVEPNIQRQGNDRILVEAPGLGDPQRLMDLIGQTAQLTLHLVVQSVSMAQAADVVEPGTMVLPTTDDPSFGYILQEQPLVRGEDLIDAQTAFDQRTREPVVSFRLDTVGARAFADVTLNNVGRQFAIVLDNQVVSAPVINEPILSGQAQISGGGTPFSVQQANDLSIILRAGALPARLTIVEQRTIGPGLGADSIRAGGYAALVGTVLVAGFMFLTYGFFGILANIALVVNVAMIFAILTLLGASLTLPGIAGIVLTIGTAVDSNVLIYERIREELRAGRSVIQAIDQGFRRAIATVIDANVTTLIAAIVLFYFGTGPIRGFAITHAIGIVTTMFTAVLVTRLMVATWVRWRRPKVIKL
ncbi:MAG: protein translocase subunit SecD [Bauldia sp.]|nr:protein translocase subunit SecD [Bauldia sp.]